MEWKNTNISKQELDKKLKEYSFLAMQAAQKSRNKSESTQTEVKDDFSVETASLEESVNETETVSKELSTKNVDEGETVGKELSEKSEEISDTTEEISEMVFSASETQTAEEINAPYEETTDVSVNPVGKIPAPDFNDFIDNHNSKISGTCENCKNKKIPESADSGS